MSNFGVPDESIVDYEPLVGMIGVGGCGCTILLKYMCKNRAADNPNVHLRAANTDAKVLKAYYHDNPNVADWKAAGAFDVIQLGAKETRGWGAGANPQVGEAAARASQHKLREFIGKVHMPLIITGEGGGTGGGASPVIAELAAENRSKVSIAVMPALNEGTRRMRRAKEGLSKLLKHSPVFILRNEYLSQFIEKRFGSIDRAKVTREEAWDAMNEETVDLVVSTVQQIFQMTGTTVNVDQADWITSFSYGSYPFIGRYETDPENAERMSAEKIVEHVLEGQFQDPSLIERGRVMIVCINGPWGTLKTDKVIELVKARIFKNNSAKAEDFEVFIGDSSALWKGKMVISVLIVADGPEDAEKAKAEAPESVVRISVPLPAPLVETPVSEPNFAQIDQALAPKASALEPFEPEARATEPPAPKTAEPHTTFCRFLSEGQWKTLKVDADIARRFQQAYNYCLKREEFDTVAKELAETTGLPVDPPERFIERSAPKKRGIFSSLWPRMVESQD